MEGWRTTPPGLRSSRGCRRTATVVAPERQAQGHTPDRPGPLTYQANDRPDRRLPHRPRPRAGRSAWMERRGHGGDPDRGGAPRTRPDADRHGVGLLQRRLRPGSDGGPRCPLARGRGHGPCSPPCMPKPPRTGPEHFPEVWEKMRTMWAEPFDWSGRGGADRPHRPWSSSATTTTSPSTTPRSSPARSSMGSWPLCPGASHLVPMEKPDLFNQLVLDFTANPLSRDADAAPAPVTRLRRRRPGPAGATPGRARSACRTRSWGG